MSRNKELYNKIHPEPEQWVAGIFVDNVSAPMLANEFVRNQSIIINSVLLSMFTTGQYVLQKYKFDDNK
jgi:hypothetical protein